VLRKRGFIETAAPQFETRKWIELQAGPELFLISTGNMQPPFQCVLGDLFLRAKWFRCEVIIHSHLMSTIRTHAAITSLLHIFS
jgi:hypothetical protein